MIESEQPWAEKWGKGELFTESGQAKLWFLPNRANPENVIKQFACKHSKADSRMIAEIKNLQELEKSGANVPRVRDANERENYFVMEFIPGKTLHEFVEQHDFSLEEAVKICLEITKTHKKAHGNKIIHRDLKPKNVVIRNWETPDVVILDWGISCDLENASNLTGTTEQLKNEMSRLPERTTPGGDRRNPRSDLTDVVTILFYCLTARYPIGLRDEKDRPIHKNFLETLNNKCSSEIQFTNSDQPVSSRKEVERFSSPETADFMLLMPKVEEALKICVSLINQRINSLVQ